MPRRVAKNVFDITRPDSDAPSESPPLAVLLPRVGEPAASAAPELLDVPRLVPNAGPAPAAPRVAERRPARGVGGRPEKVSAVAGGITAVAVRVPAPLYEAALPLVKGPGRPSWGQQVAWTSQDHAEKVLEQVEALAEAALAPRRLRGHGREGEAAMQVTARLLPAELAVVDEARNARESLQVNRTMVVIAAITVATQS